MKFVNRWPSNFGKSTISRSSDYGCKDESENRPSNVSSEITSYEATVK